MHLNDGFNSLIRQQGNASARNDTHDSTDSSPFAALPQSLGTHLPGDPMISYSPPHNCALKNLFSSQAFMIMRPDNATSSLRLEAVFIMSFIQA